MVKNYRYIYETTRSMSLSPADIVAITSTAYCRYMQKNAFDILLTYEFKERYLGIANKFK